MKSGRGVLALAPASPRRRLASAALLLAICAAMAWLHFHHPRDAPIPMRCPSLTLAGVYCPGCGSTRATHFVLQGRWMDAWRHNPALVLLGIPVGLWFVATTAYTVLAGRRVIVRLHAAIGWVLLALLILYMIARNMPATALDWLRPPASSSRNDGQGAAQNENDTLDHDRAQADRHTDPHPGASGAGGGHRPGQVSRLRL
jgi:Protein of unknown function (DUF2752)